MLDNNQIEKNKQEFLSEINKVSRPGLDKLVEWLCSEDPKDCDFFIAPSSTMYHGNYKGGLCEHSLNVLKCLRELVPMYQKLMVSRGKSPVKITDEEMIVTALLHDLCKIQFYIPQVKSAKKDDGTWFKYDGWDINDRFPFGHGEKSCFLVQRFMMLTGIEALAIRWHMGFAEISNQLDYTHKSAFNKAWDICPLAFLLHEADSMASFLLEDKISPEVTKI